MKCGKLTIVLSFSGPETIGFPYIIHVKIIQIGKITPNHYINHGFPYINHRFLGKIIYKFGSFSMSMLSYPTVFLFSYWMSENYLQIRHTSLMATVFIDIIQPYQ